MQADDLYREKSRKLIKRDLGVGGQDVFAIAARGEVSGQETALLRLPEVVQGNVPMQDAAGNLYFVAGISDPFGTDIF